jgi:rhomboid protease GluP
METRLLLWLFLLSGLYGLGVFFRRRRGVSPRLLVSLGLLTAIAGAGIALPACAPVAVLVAGPGFIVQMMLPGPLVRRGRRAAAGGRFARAARLLRLAVLLLPADPLRSEASLYRALAELAPGHPAREEVLLHLRIPVEEGGFFLAPAGLAMAAAMAVVHVAHLLLGGTDSLYAILRAGANSSELVAAGESERLLTAVFLHAGLLHLLLNAFGVIIISRWLEPRIGSARLLLAFLVCGVAGNVVSAVVYAGDGVISAGASGGAMGLFGAAAPIFFGLRRDPRMRQRLSAILVAVLFTLLLGFVEPRIDNAAHLGGFLPGVLLGLLFLRAPWLPRAVFAVAAGTMILLTAGAFGVLVARDGRWAKPRLHATERFEVAVPPFFRPRDEPDGVEFSGPPVGRVSVEWLAPGEPDPIANRITRLALEARAESGSIDISGAADAPERPGARAGSLTARAATGGRRWDLFLVPEPHGRGAALLTFEASWPDEPFRRHVLLPALWSFRFLGGDAGK